MTEVWVAAGTYTPASQGNGLRTDSFELVANVAVLGGFSGDESSADERDPAANPTVLTGDFLGNDQASDIDADGLVELIGYAENALNVVTASFIEGVVLDGFTIRSGNANYDGEELRGGGGVFLDRAGAVVRNCVFRFNTAGTNSPDIGGFGGGLFILGGDAEVLDCVFEDNRGMNGGAIGISARPDFSETIAVSVLLDRCAFRRCFSDFQTGGAIWSATSDPIFQTVEGIITARDCVFEGCSGEYFGAWIDQNTTHLLVERCEFTGNRSIVHGGAFAHSQTAGPDLEPAQVRDCSFSGNFTEGGGAGIFIQATRVVVDRCSFVGNEGDNIVRTGPVIGFSGGGQNFTILNSLIAGNDGIGIFTDNIPMLTVTNCTVADNAAPGQGLSSGGIVADIDGLQSVNITNTVLWGNSGNAGGQAGQVQVFDGAANVDFCIIQGLTGSLAGSGNLGADPQFADDAAGDYRPLAGSLALDAGDSTALPESSTLDLDGSSRYADDPGAADSGIGPAPVIDIGAYERQAAPPVCPGDLSGDNAVTSADLNVLLAAFGANGAGDLDGDGDTDSADLNILLGGFGDRCG